MVFTKCTRKNIYFRFFEKKVIYNYVIYVFQKFSIFANYIFIFLSAPCTKKSDFFDVNYIYITSKRNDGEIYFFFEKLKIYFSFSEVYQLTHCRDIQNTTPKLFPYTLTQ